MQKEKIISKGIDGMSKSYEMDYREKQQLVKEIEERKEKGLLNPKIIKKRGMQETNQAKLNFAPAQKKPDKLQQQLNKMFGKKESSLKR